MVSANFKLYKKGIVIELPFLLNDSDEYKFFITEIILKIPNIKFKLNPFRLIEIDKVQANILISYFNNKNYILNISNEVKDYLLF